MIRRIRTYGGEGAGSLLEVEGHARVGDLIRVPLKDRPGHVAEYELARDPNDTSGTGLCLVWLRVVETERERA
ncbi:MAG: hypothetical protein KF709_02520 [Gemmatimonadaceae bacterium]|nr:hypothetical protein [Gemmatimonadaceae bacterium]